MKKLWTILLAGVLVCALAACGAGETAGESAEVPAQESAAATAEPTPTAEPTAEPTPEVTEAPAEAHEITYNNTVTWTDSIGTIWAQTIIEITNTGSENLYLSSGSYDLEDENGGLVTSQSMASTYPNVIAPGEKGYICETSMLDAEPAGSLIAIPREKVKGATVDLIRYETSDIQISDTGYGDIKVLGRVENTTNEAASMVYIVAALYDADGNPVAVEFTILSDELAPGDKVGFEFQSFSLPDSVTADAVADYTIYAYPMQMQF